MGCIAVNFKVSIPRSHPHLMIWESLEVNPWLPFCFLVFFVFQKCNTTLSINYTSINMCVFLCVHALSHFSYIQLFTTLWTVACQDPLSMRLFWQEYWSGLPFPSPGESSLHKNQTHISCDSCTGRQVLYYWATWEPICNI